MLGRLIQTEILVLCLCGLGLSFVACPESTGARGERLEESGGVEWRIGPEEAGRERARQGTWCSGERTPSDPGSWSILPDAFTI